MKADIPEQKGPRPRGKWSPPTPTAPAAVPGDPLSTGVVAAQHDHNSSKGAPVEAMAHVIARGPQHERSRFPAVVVVAGTPGAGYIVFG